MKFIESLNFCITLSWDTYFYRQLILASNFKKTITTSPRTNCVLQFIKIQIIAWSEEMHCRSQYHMNIIIIKHHCLACDQRMIKINVCNLLRSKDIAITVSINAIMFNASRVWYWGTKYYVNKRLINLLKYLFVTLLQCMYLTVLLTWHNIYAWTPPEWGSQDYTLCPWWCCHAL